MFIEIPKESQIPNGYLKYSGQPISFNMCMVELSGRVIYSILLSLAKVVTLLKLCLYLSCCLITSLLALVFCLFFTVAFLPGHISFMQE